MPGHLKQFKDFLNKKQFRKVNYLNVSSQDAPNCILSFLSSSSFNWKRLHLSRLRSPFSPFCSHPAEVPLSDVTAAGERIADPNGDAVHGYDGVFHAASSITDGPNKDNSKTCKFCDESSRNYRVGRVVLNFSKEEDDVVFGNQRRY